MQAFNQRSGHSGESRNPAKLDPGLKHSGMTNHVRLRGRRGFTYIEMLAVVTLLALCFVPLLQMFAQSLDEVSQYNDLGTAIQLGREGMEIVKNLRFTEEQIESQGTVWTPPEDEPPTDINGRQWRIKRTVVPDTNPLEVHIEVFQNQNLNKSVIEIVSLIEDL